MLLSAMTLDVIERPAERQRRPRARRVMTDKHEPGSELQHPIPITDPPAPTLQVRPQRPQRVGSVSPGRPHRPGDALRPDLPLSEAVEVVGLGLNDPTADTTGLTVDDIDTAKRFTVGRRNKIVRFLI